jgi:alpha-1,3-glucan synthase
MLWGHLAVLLTVLPIAIPALRYDPDQVRYNLNENETATDPLHYWGEWDNHTFHSSPKNWRFPFYTVTLDRYVDGDPTNNEANDTVFEHHWMTNQFRFGGDARGLMNNLDYIQGMGMKGLYMTGSPFINMPWSGDGYGPLDFTLLDPHHGDIEDWRALVTEIHRRDMYVILDNTMATLVSTMTQGNQNCH